MIKNTTQVFTLKKAFLLLKLYFQKVSFMKIFFLNMGGKVWVKIIFSDTSKL